MQLKTIVNDEFSTAGCLSSGTTYKFRLTLKVISGVEKTRFYNLHLGQTDCCFVTLLYIFNQIIF